MNVWTVRDDKHNEYKPPQESKSTESLRMDDRNIDEEVDNVVNRKRSVHSQTDEGVMTSDVDHCCGMFDRRKWEEFGNTTTLHGMRFITNPRHNIVRKIIWACFVIGFMSTLVFVVVDSTHRYFNFNVSSIVTVKYVNDLIFPAVTICNYNLLRKSYAREIFGDTVLDSASLFRPIPEANRSSLEDWNITDDLIRGAHQKESMVVECKWRSSVNCTFQNFTQVLTDFGVCYTFNNPPDKASALRVQETGYDSGLYLRLNLEQYDYFFGTSKGAGFKVMIHKQGEYPFVKQLGFAVSPGFETLVTLKSTQLVNLEKPYVSQCVEENFIEGFKYTVETCQALCKMTHIVNRCGCKTSDLPAGPDLDTVRFCTYGELERCVQPELRKWHFISDVVDHCNCSLPCHRQVFTPRISEVFWPAEHISKALQEAFNSSESFLRRNIIDLVIFFEELNYEEIRQVPDYTITDLLSDVGGYMGLMVGASLITFLEFVDFLVVNLIEYCRRNNILSRRKIAISD
ncbi:acid-sensing ion channel 2-like isoform X1 [Asterias rubens]|uniref:acid-sensing ion channel 2-like isoform X1 n=1 Tax=Asterias rubens TaxID=7604 RepID=UPI001455AC10|nr:acid-sensing ion channel 2-like isoform X1 [Asterias rubens]